jgi:hypothetical protein
VTEAHVVAMHGLGLDETQPGFNIEELCGRKDIKINAPTSRVGCDIALQPSLDLENRQDRCCVAWHMTRRLDHPRERVEAF